MEQPRFCWVAITNLSWALVQSSCALQLCLIRAFVFELLGSQIEFSSWKFPPCITDRKLLGFWDKTRHLNISSAFQVPKGSRDWQIYPGPREDFRPLATINWIPGSMSYRCLKAFWTQCLQLDIPLSTSWPSSESTGVPVKGLLDFSLTCFSQEGAQARRGKMAGQEINNSRSLCYWSQSELLGTRKNQNSFLPV